MIQRIQTVYLLLVTILMALTIFSPLGSLAGNEQIYIFNTCGLYLEGENVSPTWGILFFSALSAILAFVSIFMYKNRKKQMKLVGLNSLSIILFYITLGVYYFSISGGLNLSFLNISYGIALPIIALVFNILANSKIKADEKLVQSLNRIR